MQEGPQNFSPDSPDWQYSDEAGTDNQAVSSFEQHSDDSISAHWQALEFIDHHKDTSWYVSLGIIGAVLSILMYLISSQDIVPVIVVVVAVVAFGIFASRKPRELPYTIDRNGITIGNRVYPFSSFKSFSQVEEDGNSAIWLMPNERFRPIISLYYTPEIEVSIIDALANYLPFEVREPGLIDHLMQRIKF